MPADVDTELIDTMRLAFRTEFLTAYENESKWKRTDSAPAKDLSRITWGRVACPMCGQLASAGSVYRILQGEQTGIILYHRTECPCARSRAYQKATVSLRSCHRGARLAAETTDKVTTSAERQQRSIELLRKNHEHSFLLHGAPLSGKTFLAAAIFNEAVAEWTESAKFASTACPAVYADTKTLLDEWMTYNSSRNSSDEDRVVVIPSVIPGKAKAATAAGLKPTLVLDDIHRMKETEPRVAQLVALLKAYRDEDARIVVTSSLPPKELTARWQDIPGTEDLITWMATAKKIRVSDPEGGQA
jgi:hypothetical protein